MQASLLGMQDSLRQAEKIGFEPLGLFALITAEEEAATFFYNSLLGKGYSVPNFEKLHRHPDKVKLVIFAQAIARYFFEKFAIDPKAAVRIERDGDKPKTTYRFNIGGYEVIQDDPFETIVTSGEGDDGHMAAVENAVNEVLSEVTPKGFVLKSHIRNIANRRNLCLYGDPKKKPTVGEEDFKHFKANCVVIIVLGILVFNGNTLTHSMHKLVDCLFQKISEQT